LFSPLEGGTSAGASLSKIDFEQALTELYRLKGWDPSSGAPTPEKLQSLDLGYLIQG
jgi:aldehyde:ferredoxin oxidoreductase